MVCLGGAAFITNSEKTMIINSTFEKCISQNYGGALYIKELEEKALMILSSHFLNNKAILNSCGAIYFEKTYNIRI